MHGPLSRRTFLASSVGLAMLPPTLQAARSARAAAPIDHHGPLAGRTGPRGVSAGTSGAPAEGVVYLLDGRAVPVKHSTSWRIGPRKSVLIAPEPDGAWSILYAEC